VTAYAAVRLRGLERRHVLYAAVTAAAAALLLGLGPAPGDAEVHLYRTFLVRHGAVVWDNFWYEGYYPLAGYSLLYYLPAAAVGNVTIVLAAAVASTVLFASVARREWGAAATWPSRVFSIFAAAPLFTGLYSYACGFAALLATLRALQGRRRLLAVVLVALTLGFSPLAFAFLCLVLASVLVVRRRRALSALPVAAGLGLVGALDGALQALFPSKGVYPFHLANLLAVVGVCTTGTLLARRGGADLLAWFFLLWGAGAVLLSLVRSPIGDNWTRLDEVVFPVMLLTACLARFRPRSLVTVALAGALAYNVTPYLLLVPYRLDDRPATAGYWRAPLLFLDRHAQPGYRIEVVPTAAHWESYWLPRAGFALARGWYRQLDLVDNPALYAKRLGAAAYRHWLRRTAVEYVLLPSTRLDFVAAAPEARLLRSGRSGLPAVYRSGDWTIYRVRDPSPILTGPARSRVLVFGHTTIRGVVAAPGRYRLAVHYAPFWKTSAGVCVRPAPDGLTILDLRAAGRFSLSVPSPAEAIRRAADQGDSCRASHVRS
jgi:hypothetical protein